MREVVNKLIKEFENLYGSKPDVIVSVPGRIDFLNTHQDYKGLPVVSIGVNLRTYVAANKRDDRVGYAISLNIGVKDKDVIYLDNPSLVNKKWWGNYLRACIISLRQNMYEIGGFNALIYSDVPIGAGMASSAALETSFIGSMNELYGLGLERKDIAEIAYHAEHDIMNIPCGRLDQYGCTFGGILLINTKPPYNVERLPKINGVFVVIDSGIRHSTADIHPRRQAEINSGLKQLLSMNMPKRLREKLGQYYWEPKWSEITLSEIMPYLEKIPEIPRNRILFTLKMNESTNIALDILRGKKIGEDRLKEIIETIASFYKKPRFETKEELIGAIMTYQHYLLSKLYDVSLPFLDKIVEVSIENGALGAKLSGAGLGGAVIALTKDHDTAKRVLDECIKIGASRGWIVDIDIGLTRHM